MQAGSHDRLTWLGIAAAVVLVPVVGVAWAWLYERSGSLLAPWVSHVLVDLSLILIGYDLVRVLWQ